MSTVIGGPFRCNIHEDFAETDDVNEWNEHCSTTEGHTTSGATGCVSCGKEITFENIPYQKIGTSLNLKCPDCFGKDQELNELVNSQQVAASEPQTGGEGA